METTRELCGEAPFFEVTADLSTIETADRILRESEARFGRVDILVNNAGIILRGLERIGHGA